MTRSLCTWLFGLTLASGAGSLGAETLYFEKVDLDGAGRFVGRFPLEAPALAKTDAYALTLDKAGRVAEVAYYRRGRNMPDPVFGASRVRITQDGEFEVRTKLNSRGQPVASDGIARERLKRNSDGFYTNLFQYDPAGNLQTDDAGIAAYLWVPDAQGQRKRSVRLGKDGNRAPDKNGVWELEFAYDAEGNRTGATFLDAGSRPLDGANGVGRYQWVYDADGNVVAETRFDKNGRPCADSDGIGRITWTYDNRGRVLDQAFWDASGRPVPDRLGVARYRTSYDDTLHLVRTQHLGTDGQLTLDDHGVAITREVWYDQTNEREVRTYGLALNTYYDALPAELKAGEERYLLKDDDRGISVTRWTYDADGNEVERKTWNQDLELVPDPKTGVAVVKRQFNAQGRPTAEAYFGLGGRSVENRDGLASVRWEYAGGNNTREHHFGVGGGLKEDPQGVATYQWDYDARGMKIQQTNLGLLAQPKEDVSGVAIYRWSYDKYGNLYEETHLGIDEKPTQDASGAYLLRYAVGPGGDLLLTARFDKTGKKLGN
jgi:YD repeat-containing protein